MGGEGSMAHAVVSSRENRKLLKRRKYKDVKSLLQSYSGKTALEFKKVTPEELKKIKADIRLNAKKEAKKQAMLYVLISVILLVLVVLVLV